MAGRESKGHGPADVHVDLPIMETLQVHYENEWQKKYVVIAPYGPDPSVIYVALFNDQADWNESVIGTETIRRSMCKLFRLTTFSTVVRIGGYRRYSFQLAAVGYASSAPPKGRRFAPNLR